VPQAGEPKFGLGEPVSSVAEAERAAQQVDDIDFADVDAAAMSLLYLANSGTGVGGARPKALLYDETGTYIAKFNRQRADDYNNARVELACLHMARAAGLEVGDGRILEGINGREVLLLDRFDVTPDGQRYHLITASGLLKDPNTQRDTGRAFRYDMVAELIATHVENVEQSLVQLLKLMLFNVAIHNTDDHERNFSFIRRETGYCLAPAYDLMPSLTTGDYHSAGFGYAVAPPRPSEIARHGKVFGLPKPVVKRVAQQVIDAVSRWAEFAGAAGASDEETARISRVLKL
jgi:serine/threonine-protein kinase HipA